MYEIENGLRSFAAHRWRKTLVKIPGVGVELTLHNEHDSDLTPTDAISVDLRRKEGTDKANFINAFFYNSMRYSYLEINC